jgi:hypothetical protein
VKLANQFVFTVLPECKLLNLRGANKKMAVHIPRVRSLFLSLSFFAVLIFSLMPFTLLYIFIPSRGEKYLNSQHFCLALAECIPLATN